MNYKLLFNTLINLKPIQVYYQIKYRLYNPNFKVYQFHEKTNCVKWLEKPIAKPQSWDGTNFTFLNIKSAFTNWDNAEHGMLWAYNLNYFDYINQENTKGCNDEDKILLIDKFIDELTINKIGLDPYPIALRGINWIKFFVDNPSVVTKKRLDYLYSQYRLLEKKIEYHLLANHLLEDAFSLFIGALFFNEDRMFNKAACLLIKELNEQILDDGAHYEQSPMYHCILLDRLLDCINYSHTVCKINNNNLKGLTETTEKLKFFATKMLGHLKSIIWTNGNIPLLNDSALGIAPTPAELFNYADRLRIKYTAIPMKECGYRKIYVGDFELIVDCGNITATYQPGHTHADTLNYELHVGGKPFIVDTGISTYNKNNRRQYERSTAAHNCITVQDTYLNSSEVWGGFRVGRRAKSTILDDNSKCISVECKTAYGDTQRRTFILNESGLSITDESKMNSLSLIHLSPKVKLENIKKDENKEIFTITTSSGSITVENAISVKTSQCKVSDTYNKFEDATCIEIAFNNKVKYTIL